MGEQKVGLKELMLGSPLSIREDEEKIKEGLNKHLRGMLELIPKVYGNSEAAKQAVMEVKHVVEMDSIPCKRAMVLYGLFAEREICDYWSSNQADGSAALAKDLQSRVLPFVTPRFFKHSCQSPETFVVLSMMLAEMWGGEKLGNWPNVP